MVIRAGMVEDKTEFVEKIASGKSDFVTIDLKDQTISISGKTAMVRHKLNATTNDNGKPGEVHLAILLHFWQKDIQAMETVSKAGVKLAL